MGHVNQCDGCRRGLPLNENRVHVKDGRAWMTCTRERYVSEKPTAPKPLEPKK